MEFSDLALAKLLQVAPELGPLVLNFTQIDEEIDSENVDVGVFILRTGLGVCYIPVVSGAGTVYPMDSAFLEEEARFVPLTPAYIRKMSSGAGNSLGRVSKVPNSVSANPDLTSLVNPPRTGKYVYASASRLTEFLASLPNNIKKFTFEKIASEASLYDAMDKMFGLKSMLEVLKPSSESSNTNSASTGPEWARDKTVSVITTPAEVRQLNDEAATAQFLQYGYAVTGSRPTSRVAVLHNVFADHGQFRTVNPGVDGGNDYMAVMSDGSEVQVTSLKAHPSNPIRGDKSISVMENSDYIKGQFLTCGEPLPKVQALTSLFDKQPPKLLKNCEWDETFIILTSSGEYLGPFDARNIVQTPIGVEVSVSGCSDDTTKIIGSKNLITEVEKVGRTLFVKFNALVIVLGKNLSCDLATNINHAQATKELVATKMLGSELNIRHDGVEFSFNGTPVGPAAIALKVLVEQEQLDPTVAGSFLKQAEDTTFAKVFMSKVAATGPGSVVPSEFNTYGTNPPDAGAIAPNGSFIPALSDAAQVGDGQVMEATVISQLLQFPDLYEVINEYLPDLKTAVDKLGRTLFMSRVKLDQLSSTMDSDSVFALIAKIKSVYRMLGDTVAKLEEVSNVGANYVKPEGSKISNGV